MNFSTFLKTRLTSTVMPTFLCRDRDRLVTVPVLSKPRSPITVFERTGTGRWRDGHGHGTKTLASRSHIRLHRIFYQYIAGYEKLLNFELCLDPVGLSCFWNKLFLVVYLFINMALDSLIKGKKDYSYYIMHICVMNIK